MNRRELLRLALAVPAAASACSPARSPAPAPYPVAPAIAPPAARRDLRKALQATYDRLGPRGILVAGFDTKDILFRESFGSAVPDAQRPIEIETPMPIASVSKMLTAVSLSTLVRDARLGWDDKLTSIAPSLKLHPAYEKDVPLLRDVLAHRTGLPMWAGDMLWYRSENPWSFVKSRVEYMEPSTPIRSAFSYSNILVTALREAFEARGGRSWQETLRREIFSPAGMTGTVTSDEEAAALTGMATPITKMDGPATPAAPLALDAIAPAGGVRSHARDLVRFGQLVLRRREESSPLSAAIVESMWEPHLALPLSLQRRKLTPETITIGTGLGCFFMLHAGRRLVLHGGALPGISTLLLLAPEDGVGLVVMSNADDDLIVRVMTFIALDDLLRLEPVDWLSRFEAVAAANKAPPPRSAVSSPLTTADEKALAGTYRSKVYGNATLTADPGGPKLRLEHHPTVTGVVSKKMGGGYLVDMNPKHLGPMSIAVQKKKDSVVAFECCFGPEFIDGLVYRFERA